MSCFKIKYNMENKFAIKYAYLLVILLLITGCQSNNTKDIIKNL